MGIFDDPNWFLVRSKFVRAFLPNEVWHNPTEKKAAIVVKRSLNGDDYCLSRDGFKYVKEAKEAGRIAEAYLTLIERDRTLVNQTLLSEVKLGEPIPSSFKGRSDYWWLDANFKDPNGRRDDDDDDGVPF